ncbi:MAG: DUF433 domain-containing protein [Dehalococcoidia bacterium]|nr:DUF433 domain-containing protein [Dehalococcoidia bacterium]
MDEAGAGLSSPQPPVSDPFRTGKAYSISEAARLAGTTSATVRRWIAGYDAIGHHMEPVFGEKDRPTQKVSFLELVEIIVAVGFRRDKKIKLERIRRAHEYARKVWLTPFPFASMKFAEFGGHLIHDFETAEPGSGRMAFDLQGQWVLPEIVQDALSSLEFESDDNLAARWYPFGKAARIVVDPHYAAGRPVVEGTRVPVQVIRERFAAGDSIRHLATDYGLQSSVVEEVLRHAA